MKRLVHTLKDIKIHQYLILSTELSSQSHPRLQQPPAPVPHIYFYKDENGFLPELHGHVRPGILENYIIGIVENGVLRKVYDHRRQMVVIHRLNMFNVPLGEEESRMFPYDRHLPFEGVIEANFTYYFQ